MTLIQIVIGILMIGSFMEYSHLNKNNIRHDERPWLFISMALFVALILTLVCDFDKYPN